MTFIPDNTETDFTREDPDHIRQNNTRLDIFNIFKTEFL